MLLNCGVGEDSWESLGLQGYTTSPSARKSVLNIHWKDWCWSRNSNSLATWCEELTYLKRPWCWERLKAGREGDNRVWDGWMASPTQWAWVWINSRSCDGQGGLACCGPWGCKESDLTEQLNWTPQPGLRISFKADMQRKTLFGGRETLILTMCLVTQLCPILCDLMDCCPPGFSIHGISQERILEWVSIYYSREFSQPRDWTWVSCLAGRVFTTGPLSWDT